MPEPTHPPMQPAVAVSIPPVALEALRVARHALLTNPDALYDDLSTAMLALAERQMLITPEQAAAIDREARADVLLKSAVDIEAETDNCHRPLECAACGTREEVAAELRRQALELEAGKDTPAGDESTRVDDGEARCAKCGCTESTPCEGGCGWVPGTLMRDLCSACVAPLSLHWDQTLTLPAPGTTPEQPAVVPCHVDDGTPAVLSLSWQERLALASLLDAHMMDTSQPCTTPKCGISEEELAESIPQLGTPPYAWIKSHVYGTTGPECWWCSPWCAQVAVARSGAELAAADDLDARYGAGAADEHAAQQAEALEDGFAAEKVYDPAEDEAGGER